MATSLDMSLDDLIKNRGSRERVRGGRGRARCGRGPGRARTGGRMPGGVRRGSLGVNARPSSYTIAKSVRRTRNFPWHHDLFEESLRAAWIPEIEIGTKLYVSNLDSGVTNEDIRELFSEIGDVKRYAVHYDKNGRQSIEPGTHTLSLSLSNSLAFTTTQSRRAASARPGMGVSETVFKSARIQRSKSGVISIPWGEIARFSHQIPAFQHSGERDIRFRGCWELDPKAVPGFIV